MARHDVTPQRSLVILAAMREELGQLGPYVSQEDAEAAARYRMAHAMWLEYLERYGPKFCLMRPDQERIRPDGG